MAQHPVTHSQGHTSNLLNPLVLILLLILYGAGMMALPVYFFGLTVGLWLSAALLVGGIGVVVVLSGANRGHETGQETAPLSHTIRLKPRPAQSWARPRVTPFQ